MQRDEEDALMRVSGRLGIRIVYLLPYCPELNPIELGFGILKMRLRHSQALQRRADQIEAIRRAAEATFDCPLLKKLYYKCGYRLPTDYRPRV